MNIYYFAIGLGITLIFIIYAQATRKTYANKLLLMWFFCALAAFGYSLSISNPPEWIEQLEAILYSFSGH